MVEAEGADRDALWADERIVASAATIVEGGSQIIGLLAGAEGALLGVLCTAKGNNSAAAEQDAAVVVAVERFFRRALCGVGEQVASVDDDGTRLAVIAVDGIITRAGADCGASRKGDGADAVQAVVVAMHEEPPATDVDALISLNALRCIVGSLNADVTALDAD